MKARILSILAAIAAFLTVLGGLDLSGMIHLFPNEVATGLTTALPALAVLTHLIRALGDAFDDGQINGSFKAIAFFLVLSVMCFGMVACQHLAGTTISFDENGNAVVIPPPTKPIVIPAVDGGK
ncbi:hypothetical protein OKA04_23385 [Luteolibacter flavescens]|uniref:Uncharacterized protein n=1 Tax=Luteolibacter flavescens TaxID=1859460 RepID=A0ABT3FVW0_9BACT|nr:hypothetical protein [Luteolibacter flavescens]MCW1887700.1 hypothetical protein [Luteolibacter flavescens]